MSATHVDTHAVDSSKRTWIIASTCAGAVGAAAVAVPFVSTFQPSERAQAAGRASEQQTRVKNRGGCGHEMGKNERLYAKNRWIVPFV